MVESSKESLYANFWVIRSRWFYTIAVLGLGFLSNFDQSRTPEQVLPLRLLLISFGLVWLCNLILYGMAKAVEKSGKYNYSTALAVLQIAMELLFLAGIMFAVAEFKTIVPVLFFIPIVESIVLFDRIGPAVVAVFASVMINTVLMFGVYLFPDQRSGIWSLFLTNTAPITIVYLIIGFFASSFAHLLHGRGTALANQSSVQLRGVEELEQLNKDLEKKANQLYAKDLELTLANQRLQTLEAAKSKFIAVTTHQLRTPLAALKWTFDMAVKEQLGPLNKDQKEFLQKGYESTQRVIEIVNQLLNAGSFDRNDLEKLNYIPVQLVDLVSSVVFEFSNQAESKNIKLEFLKPVKILPLVDLDPGKIRMVLENLIDNAVKYTPKYGQVTIVIDDAKINTARPFVDIAIIDTGIGVSAAEQKNIFQKFYRAGNAIAVEPDGTGLGLFIGKDIIEKHHGSLWFTSEQGKGSRFYISLPINQPK